MEKDYDYKEQMIKEELPNLDVWPKKAKIILGITIGIAVLLLIFLIIVIAYYQKKLSQNQPTPSPSPSSVNTLYNLTYDDNGKIENSFKTDGYNHIEGVDSINDNKDYEKNERNIYDLYIPKYAMNRKNDSNGIFLWIHGGAWALGDKTSMDKFCKIFSEQGYISAALGYTLLATEFKEFNIFKNMDEITACIKAIKNKLVSLGFNENKLYLAIGGYSSGAHLTLLYSYLNSKIDIIPLKFIVDFVGPIGLYPKYFYKLKSINETLPNIEDVSIIEEAMNKGTIIPIYKEVVTLYFMNLFSGNKFNDSLNEMIFPNETINYENEKFKEMFKIVKNGFITKIVDKNKIPTICIYGGTDEIVGVSTFAYLKQKMDIDARKYDFIYSRYEGHSVIFPKTPDGEQKLRVTMSKIDQYLKEYFGY